MIKIKEIIDVCNAKLLQGNINEECLNFCQDTRIIQENDTYVAIKGESFDGNNFCIDALEKGVKTCILDRKIDIPDKYSDRTIILVEDSVKCLQDLARYKISKFNGKVIAITGSVGKTSTKDMIASVVSRKYKTLKTQGNNNNEIGLPLTILKYTDEEVMILEMGMNHFKEISLLTNIAKPDIAVITNIGTAHIGILGSRENILKAKLEIIEGLKPNGKLIINNDNDLLHSYYEENKNENIITIGIDNNSDYNARNIEINEDICNYEIGDNKVTLNIPTTPFIYNSLIAYVVGKELNIEDSLIIKGIKEFNLTKNRLEIKINKKEVVIIDDTYNASFDSVKASLEMLKLRKEKRKILVLGDILELGDFSESIHRSIAKEVIDADIDILITVGKEINYLVDELVSNDYQKEMYHFDRYDETYELLNQILKKGDVILLKASHSINLTKVVDYLMK